MLNSWRNPFAPIIYNNDRQSIGDDHHNADYVIVVVVAADDDDGDDECV